MLSPRMQIECPARRARTRAARDPGAAAIISGYSRTMAQAWKSLRSSRHAGFAHCHTAASTDVLSQVSVA
eukprot:849371-Prymnesium_polylepis.1